MTGKVGIGFSAVEKMFGPREQAMFVLKGIGAVTTVEGVVVVVTVVISWELCWLGTVIKKQELK